MNTTYGLAVTFLTYMITSVSCYPRRIYLVADDSDLPGLAQIVGVNAEIADAESLQLNSADNDP